MNLGIPKEIMTGEARVALTPEACEVWIKAGCAVYVQQDAGANSSYDDNDYRQSGAATVEITVETTDETAQQLYDSAKHCVGP